MIQKHYSPDEVWRAFKRGGDDELLLAENTDYGVAITISADSGLGGLPVIVVTADDQLLFEEAVVSQDDCTQTAKKVFAEYLDEQRIIQHFLDADKKSDENAGKESNAERTETDADEYGQEIDDREDELREALTDFLVVVTDGCYVDDEETVSDCLDHFLEYLARKWGYESIRRPMILEDENGEEFFEDYPYEIMEYDDPDNPLYK